MRYPFEYFCGANVIVCLRDGYSSRHFDAVARGQVLVEGTLLINYVHQDYLFHAARLAIAQNPSEVTKDEGRTVVDTTTFPFEFTYIPPQNNSEPPTSQEIAEKTKRYWSDQLRPVGNTDGFSGTENLHDGGSFSIRVVFGNQSGDRPAGDTGLLLSSVHFTGRGQTIQIDQETIVEAYSFIARNVHSLANPSPMIVQKTMNGDINTTLQK